MFHFNLAVVKQWEPVYYDTLIDSDTLFQGAWRDNPEREASPQDWSVSFVEPFDQFTKVALILQSPSEELKESFAAIVHLHSKRAGFSNFIDDKFRSQLRRENFEAFEICRIGLASENEKIIKIIRSSLADIVLMVTDRHLYDVELRRKENSVSVSCVTTSRSQ